MSQSQTQVDDDADAVAAGDAYGDADAEADNETLDDIFWTVFELREDQRDRLLHSDWSFTLDSDFDQLDFIYFY